MNAQTQPLQPGDPHDLEGFVLSPQQRLAWRVRREGAAPGRAACLVRVEGAVDGDRLERALNRIARQHEILRTRFAVLPPADLPVQVVEPEPRIKVQHHQRLRGGKLSARETAERAWDDLERRPHDPAELDCLRAAWVQEDEAGGYLVLSQSELHGDRKSLELLLEELAADLARGEGPSAALKEPAPAVDPDDLDDLDEGEALLEDDGPFQYADVSQFLVDLLHAEDSEEGFAFWRQAFSEPPLEIGLARRAGPTTGERVETVLVDERVADAVHSYATKLGVEPAAVYCAAWQVVLARHSGRERFVLGIASGGRTIDGLDTCLGPLEKHVPLPCRISEELGFADVVMGVAEALEVADERQEHFDFERAAPGRSFGYAVGFEFLPEVDPFHVDTPDGELALRPVAFRTSGGNFGLKLVCDASVTPNVLHLSHSPEVLSTAAAERLLDQVRTVLERARGRDDRPLSEISSISRAEAALLDGFAFEGPRPGVAQEVEELVTERFARCVVQVPEAAAVTVAGRTLTYAELADRSRRLARRLVEAGVGPGTFVGIHMGRSVDLVVGIVAVIEAGGAYLPLPPDYPPERLAFMLADSGASVVLTREREAGNLTAFDGRVLVLEQEAAALAALSGEALEPRARADSPAYLIYTSGSSGRPKGVPIHHGALAHSTQARLETYAEPLTGYLLVSSFAFDSSVAGIFWTLAAGGRLVLPEDGFERDLPSLAPLVREHALSHLLALPSLWTTLLETAPGELASLTTVIVAGESCPRELVAKHLDTLPSATLYNEYGPTENTVWSTVQACTRVPVRTRVPIGRPIPRVEVRVLDAEQRPRALGVAGELCLGGPGLANGYLGRPELSAERFVTHPSGEGRLYRTGDLVRFLETGELEFLGRLDHQVKLRGHRIELEEIETVLMSHPRLREVAVGVRGEGERARLVAWFVPALGPLNPVELKAHLVSRLPQIMIPGDWVEMSALPLLPNGKIDRVDLPDPAGTRTTPYVAPVTPLERVVCAVWAEVLGVERVGTRDDFFALGGHSILATQLVARLADLLKADLAIRALFDRPTPAGNVATFLATPDRARVERTAELLLEVLELDPDDGSLGQAS